VPRKEKARTFPESTLRGGGENFPEERETQQPRETKESQAKPMTNNTQPIVKEKGFQGDYKLVQGGENVDEDAIKDVVV